MKHPVGNHGNSFSYELLRVVVFERRDYSVVMWLENAGVVSGEKHNFHIL
jgi:hypothetical protein